MAFTASDATYDSRHHRARLDRRPHRRVYRRRYWRRTRLRKTHRDRRTRCQALCYRARQRGYFNCRRDHGCRR